MVHHRTSPNTTRKSSVFRLEDHRSLRDDTDKEVNRYRSKDEIESGDAGSRCRRSSPLQHFRTYRRYVRGEFWSFPFVLPQHYVSRFHMGSSSSLWMEQYVVVEIGMDTPKSPSTWRQQQKPGPAVSNTRPSRILGLLSCCQPH